MTDLPRRRLGQTGMTPSALGLGGAAFGGDASSDADAVAGVRRAVELGIDYVDTSPLYGQSERRVGLALQGGRRERVYLQTKTGTHPERRGDFVGLGVRQHAFHRRAVATGHLEISLTYLDYNLIDPSAAAGIFPAAREHGVGVILASVFGVGLLTGLEPDPQDERRKYAGCDREPVAHRMWEWCLQRGLQIRHLAMQFCLAAPIAGIAMAGPANRAQVEAAHEAATTAVPQEVWAAFRVEFGVGL